MDRGYHSYLAKILCPSRLLAPYVFPGFHKACPPQDSDWRHQYNQLTLIPTQILQTYMDPNQISSTDVSLCPMILSRCRSSLPRHHNQSQPTWDPTKYLQQTSGIPRSLSGIDHLRDQTPRLPPKFPTYAAAAGIIFNQWCIS